MNTDLTPAQKALAEFMSSLSERCYYAGWLANLEYVLWNALDNGPRSYGHDKITQEDIDTLKTLCTAADCWIVFDDITEETPVSIAAWREQFASVVKNDPAILKG